MSVSFNQRVDLRLAASPRSIAPLRRAVASYAEDHGASQRDCDDIALAVSEALSNVVVHAYADRDEPGDIRVQAWIDDGDLHVAVSDDGIGMMPRADSPGLGLGLAIIGRIADHLRVETSESGAGVRVHMIFSIG